MLNIHDLESRHKKYKLKSYLPYALLFVLGLVLVFLSISFLYNNDNNKEIVSLEIKNISKTKELNKTIQTNKNKTTIKNEVDAKPISKIKKHERTTLSPSLDFLKILQPHDIYNSEPVKNNIKNEKLNEAIKKDVKKQQEQPTEQITKEEVIYETKDFKTKLIIKKKNSIKIKRNNSEEEIKHVIKRFKNNNKPALSLFIAKKYYELGRYKESYNYALITNQINTNIEASWIIFAKSLIKLNEKEMAIKTLKKYIDHSHSSQAKILLDDIKSGKFK